MRRKSIGLSRGDYATLKERVEWGFGISMLLIWRCWRSRHGGLSMRLTHYFIVSTRHDISPLCFFLEANLGTNPFFVWCSLIQAREVIREGSVWQLGNGRMIGVNTNKWLPRPPGSERGQTEA